LSGRPLPSIERALSGPAKDRSPDWHRRVKVVRGGQGPGKPDAEALDRDRARLPLTGPRRIVVLGCTSGAGQTVTALMTGHILAALREIPVAALDLNPGEGSLTQHAPVAPVTRVSALLAGSVPDGPPPVPPDGLPPEARNTQARLEVIASDADPGVALALDDGDYARLAERLGAHYPMTMIDAGASIMTRVLAIADQLVLVAPASSEAPRSLAKLQEWLDENGHRDLAARAVTLVSGVSKRTLPDVLETESVARGRCRAIVRVPWDDLLTGAAAGPTSLRPQTRLAYTALAGVIVAGLAAAPIPRKVHVPGEAQR
jgi:MinD-like ATPase involved in chromosome partitioning or flagellar assembly